MEILNVQEMVFIEKYNTWFQTRRFFQVVFTSHKWYSLHTSGITSIYGVNHARRWFHKWSSTLSDHQIKNASLTYKSSSVSNGWPMLSHRGRCPTNWSQDQKSYVWYLKKPYTRYKCYLQMVTFQQSSDIHKKCKIQASTIYPKRIPLHQWEAHLLWKLMTKGER